MARARKRAAGRYSQGFLARYLRPLIFEQTIARGWRQYHVAKWLGLTNHSLSEYLNRRAHPAMESLPQFEVLGCDVQRLRRAIVADKLLLWMEQLQLNSGDVERALRRIDASTGPVHTSESRPIAGQSPPAAARANTPDRVTDALDLS